MTTTLSSQTPGASPAMGATRARYIMIGGFLGAGKTTAVSRLARLLSDRGLKVGLITNDQGSQLVDTAMLLSHGFSVEEIAGGCFCCRFNSLVEAAGRLSAQTRPDVFLAEPVGSCTDLVATVSYPLRRIYGEQFAIAPLSVLVDPVRAMRVFGLVAGGQFSEKVVYIYRKQLEEADLIVVNKCDLLQPGQDAALEAALRAHNPRAEVLFVSARQGIGMEAWFERIWTAQAGSGEAMEVDYDVYAEGEALLGWLNATVILEAATEWDGNAALQTLARQIQNRLNGLGTEVAHLKMTLSPDNGLGELAVINLVRNDFVAELSQELPEPVLRGEVILNMRAENGPEALRRVVAEAVQDSFSSPDGPVARMEHLEFFRPGKPSPTHRLVQAPPTSPG